MKVSLHAPAAHIFMGDVLACCHLLSVTFILLSPALSPALACSPLITFPSVQSTCCAGLTPSHLSCLPVFPQAWLTEIHEYTQQDVVLMLLGNKVRPPQGHSMGEPYHRPVVCCESVSDWERTLPGANQLSAPGNSTEEVTSVGEWWDDGEGCVVVVSMPGCLFEEFFSW